MNRIQPVSMLNGLPRGLQHDGAISIELDGGVPVLRVSHTAQDRVEDLLQKQKHSRLTPDEEQELQQHEDVDDYLTHLTRYGGRNPLEGLETTSNCGFLKN